ncbi:hypothetical protein FisN_7Lh333 [Fistulifera solaris]|uniref:Uncharacterized protein n=1 Tax=Fistulifera solaris TaxID=1519565 RepID=A0A1Z5JS61_FISSO|nr:hypothetical protein FisN_7Lh333 [Fistulifera solaris]|eukprot:GAX16601.1 hypothetical protein FisN_7Lh333 [Fistulifera solaris]
MMYPLLSAIGANKQSDRSSIDDSSIIIGNRETRCILRHRLVPKSRSYDFFTILEPIIENKAHESSVEVNEEQREFNRPQLLQRTSATDWSELSCIIHDDIAESSTMHQQHHHSLAVTEDEVLELVTRACDGLHLADC